MPPDRHAILLRGINVAGKNPLPSKELAVLVTAAGCTAVSTYIQSGNIVCTAPPALVSELPSTIQSAIRSKYGYQVPVITRSAAQLASVAQNNPFLAAGADPAMLHVIFLAATPDASAVSKLDPQRSPGDEWAVVGSDVYLRLPNGVARSKLTVAYFESKLGMAATQRNWRTVLKLLQMCEAPL
jgi:uncharacterized protein (DUF1697 family)